jgi:hypothetical protein
MFMENKIIYEDLPFVDPYRRIHRPQTHVFQKPTLTSYSLLTSLDILEKPIAHKGPDKPLSWIQNPVVRPTHEIPRLVNMIHN